MDSIERDDQRFRNKLYFAIWTWLLLLFGVGMAVFALNLTRKMAATLIFGLAAIKAVLVLRYYMHLKREHVLIYLMVVVPLLFFAAFALSLVPDIVWRHGFRG